MFKNFMIIADVRNSYDSSLDRLGASFSVSQEIFSKAMRFCSNDEKRAYEYIAFWIFVGEDSEYLSVENVRAVR